MKTTDTFILILHDLGALTFSFHLFFCNSSILKYIHPFLQFKNVYFHAVKFFRLHSHIINFFRHFTICLMKSDSCKNILYIIQFTHNISSSHPSDTEDMMNDTTNIEKVVVCYGLSSLYLYLYMSLNISFYITIHFKFLHTLVWNYLWLLIMLCIEIFFNVVEVITRRGYLSRQKWKNELVLNPGWSFLLSLTYFFFSLILEFYPFTIGNSYSCNVSLLAIISEAYFIAKV